MPVIHDSHISWIFWSEYIRNLMEKDKIDRNKTVQKVRNRLKKERSKNLKKLYSRKINQYYREEKK